MTANAPSAPDMAEAMEGALSVTPADGETLSLFLSRLSGRAHGALAVITGLLLLLPVRWALPQLCGVLLAVSGWRIFAGSPAPFLPFLGAARLSHKRLAWLTVLTRQDWLRIAVRPRVAGFATGFASHAAAAALIAGGLAALVPSTHYLLAIGLIILGLGMMQNDGLACLSGLALTLAASAFTLTLAAGAAANAPFAAPWARENLPFLSPPARTLVPDDHASR